MAMEGAVLSIFLSTTNDVAAVSVPCYDCRHWCCWYYSRRRPTLREFGSGYASPAPPWSRCCHCHCFARYPCSTSLPTCSTSFEQQLIQYQINHLGGISSILLPHASRRATAPTALRLTLQTSSSPRSARPCSRWGAANTFEKLRSMPFEGKARRTSRGPTTRLMDGHSEPSFKTSRAESVESGVV